MGTYDVSFWLNNGKDGGPRANVRMLVEVPDQDSIDDEYELVANTAKDALRPFLNSNAYFGEWDPIPVYAHTGSRTVDTESSAPSHNLQEDAS